MAFSYRLDMSASGLSIAGKVFVHPETKEPYGPIRSVTNGRSVLDLNGCLLSAFAEDPCGNYFVTETNGRILFWDHETSDISPLADSIEAFISSCEDPEEVVLDPNKVKSVWIDPAFAKSLGIETPKDGWIKKSTK